MSSAFRRNFLILWSDLLIALSAFWLARYFGDMPRWYWLVLSAVVWVVLGGVSRKLQFGAYKRIRYAFLGIFALDVLSGLFLCTLYRYCVPGYEYDYSIILPPASSLCSNGRCTVPSDGWFTGKSLSSTKSLCWTM